MARPIRETPILFGEDARRFEERMKQRRIIPKEELERIKASYDLVMQWMENGKKYEEELRKAEGKKAESR